MFLITNTYLHAHLPTSPHQILIFIISFPFLTTYFKEIDTYGYLLNYNGKVENCFQSTVYLVFATYLVTEGWGQSNEQNNVPFLREFTFY